MAYKHKYLKETSYSFYNNSDNLEDDANFNYWLFKLVHADTFTEAVGDLGTLVKDIISGSSYRWYIEDYSIPSYVANGCYRFIVEDTISGNVFYISDEVEITDSSNGLMFVSYRNDKDILNFNYELLPDYRNIFHVEMFKRKPQKGEDVEGFPKVNDAFQRVRTTLSKSYEFVTAWFDEAEHDATHVMSIHSSLNIAFDGQFNSMTKNDNSDYSPEYQENYEFVQVAFRLNKDDENSSNKSV